MRGERLSGLSNASWVEIGGDHQVLAMAAPPGGGDLPGEGGDRGPGGVFSRLRELGVRRAVYLLDPWGIASMYGSEEGLARLYLAAGIQPHWVPTPNLGVPTDLEPMRQAVRFLLEGGSRSAAVHCRAGVGRTGLVLTCLMVARGVSWQQARKSLGQQRYPLQSREQVEFLRRFDEAGGIGA